MMTTHEDFSTSKWTAARNPSADTSSPSSGKVRLPSTPIKEDKISTGAKGTDLDNHSNIDSVSVDYTTMPLATLRQSIRHTILDTPEDELLNPDRPIRLKTTITTSRLHPEHVDREEEVADSGDNEEVQTLEDYNTMQDEQSEQEEITATEDGEFSQDQELEMSQDDENQDITDSTTTSQRDTSLADFDVSKTLPTDKSYLLFVPSGETIEAQYFSLITSFWIARHSNRTLIIPPPIMAPPSLHHIYPIFATPRGKLPQHWNTLLDLRAISALQPFILIEDIRHMPPMHFTDEMTKEEETPTTSRQTFPFATGNAPNPITCHGPPAAGSWKSLDFAGRRFLNSYNLEANFKIPQDSYWDLTPQSIQQNWKASTASIGGVQEDRQRQLICITGADLLGAEDPEIEEAIWRDIGAKVSFSNAVKQVARRTIKQVLRALDGVDRMKGHVGIHIDKLPPRELCGTGYNEKVSYVPAIFKGAQSKAIVPSQCAWTVDLIAKRIAILQRTNEIGPRAVIVTTTETDPAILAKIDQQEGWVRVGSEDTANLFDMTPIELGGYGEALSKNFLMSSSAVFVGNRGSPLAVHASFRIKYEGVSKNIGGHRPRWELY
ncbi:hypothetical protein BGZ49_006895 [Haplosporangium sp. Z 27]|nr:hypothetical protein BGZ49_006895 [Haplosporangium sp. Z 27]